MRTKRILLKLRQITFLAISTLCCVPATHAQGFAAVVSPPRFELNAAPGETSRQVIDIRHVGAAAAKYRVYTNDWSYGPDGTVHFKDELATGSCRPWVAIERSELALDAGKRFRYRFEVTPPSYAGQGECRFALMIEGQDTAKLDHGNVKMPVGGRIGVIVYLQVGKAAPVLEIVGTHVAKVDNRLLPVLDVRNCGDAHGRLDGFLEGKDATGREFEMAPADGPILPSETRSMAIVPVGQEGAAQPEIRYPLTVKGTLEWQSGKLPIDFRFSP